MPMGSTFCDQGTSGNTMDTYWAVRGDFLMTTNDSGGGAYGAWCHTGTWNGAGDKVIEAVDSGVRLGEASGYRTADQAALMRVNAGAVPIELAY